MAAESSVGSPPPRRTTLPSIVPVASGRPAASTVVVKILASHRPTSLASILGEIRRVTHRRPSVTLGQSPMTSLQTRDLRFDSVVWADLDRLAATPLQVGVAATLADLRSSLDGGPRHR